MATELTINARGDRHCVARRVKRWRKAETMARLYSGRCEGSFRLLESNDWPANETWFDVAFDDANIHVSVLSLEAANSGLVADGFTRDTDSVEVFFDPFLDRLGYLQVIAGSEGDSSQHSHWPYRDPERIWPGEVSWSVDREREIHRPDLARFTFFRFDLETVRAGDCIGFNVGRSQHRISENSIWNPASGIGFADAGCFGRLWFRKPPIIVDHAEIALRNGRLESIRLAARVSGSRQAKLAARLLSPSGTEIAAWRLRKITGELQLNPARALSLRESGRYRVVLDGRVDGSDCVVEPGEFFFDHAGVRREAFQFQGTYDWPDNFGNVAYTPKDLENEMKWYKECGLDRLYWIDYPAETWLNRDVQEPGHWRNSIQRSYDSFGGDFLPKAVRAAHKAGQEFITIFKPFDLRPAEPFITQNPQLCIRRNPAWTRAPVLPITEIRIFQGDTRSFPFQAKDLTVWQSDDNKVYRRAGKASSVNERVVRRPASAWSPVGQTAGAARLRVRRLAIGGLNITSPYLALTVNTCNPAAALRNRRHLLAEVVVADGSALPCLVDVHDRLPKAGFDFGPRITNAPAWGRADAGIDQLVAIQGERLAVGLTTAQAPYLPGFLEPSFAEVRAFWLKKLERGIRAGADGVSIRIAHHVGCVDWLSYVYAEPVLDAFRERTGRDPLADHADTELIRSIRGEFYTQFVREASAMARQAGRLFSHHLENRMLVPHGVDAYCQIHWDWRRWITERLVDEVDLKYIGPNHPDCYREIVPLARQHGVKVNWICSDPEPRSNHRSVNESPQFMEAAVNAGLNGINLYELWLYRRMTDNGMPMTRGSGEAIIRGMRAKLEELQAK